MKTKISTIILFLFCASFSQIIQSQTWRSELYPENWTPEFNKDGKFLHDFSYAGYMRGEEPIPESVGSEFIDVTKAPYNVDNTGADDVTNTLQKALDDIGKKGGGTVYLPEGTYKVRPQGNNNAALYVRYSNIILKGAGIGKTFIRCFAENMRNQQIILVGTAKNWNNAEDGKVYQISRDIPDNPSKTIYLNDIENLKVGDWIIVRSDRSSAWIEEHQMSGFWAPDANMGTTFYRQITGIDTGNKSISIDIPTRYYMKTRDNARVYKVTPDISNVGLEGFSIGNKSNPKTNGWGEEDYKDSNSGSYQVHAAFLIKFTCAVHSWARDIASYQAGNTKEIHMSSNGLDLDRCRNITIEKCDFSYPQYLGGGGNGYAINLCSQECLIINCTSTSVRHGYAFKYSYANGNVIHAFTSLNPVYASDFHMYLSMSNLIDNQNINGDFIESCVRPYGANKGNYHGVTSSQTVFWNTNGIAYKGNNFIIDSRQHGYGYIIGTRGPAYNVRVSPTTMNSQYGSVNTAPEDHVEGLNKGANLEPYSLYFDQLGKRLNKDICIPVFANENDGNVAENVLDGDLKTRWSANGDGKWIEFCLGDDPVIVSGIRIAFHNGNVRSSKFDVLYSIDGKEWTPAATNLSSSGKSLDLEEFIFSSSCKAKRIRIVGHGNSVNKWNSFTEVEIIHSPSAIETYNIQSTKKKISLYPNPISSNDNLTIRFNASIEEEGNINISDLSGRTVFSELLSFNNNELTLNNFHLESGVYAVTVNSKEGNTSELLIVK